MESILGVGVAPTILPGERPNKEQTCLWRIQDTVGDIIWRLRCEGVIGHADVKNWKHYSQSVAEQWLRAINSRLRQDIIAAQPRFGRQVLEKKIVREAWDELQEIRAGSPRD